MLAAVLLLAGCASRVASATSSSTPSSAVRVEAHVSPCPVPAADYAGTTYSPHAAPASTNLPASLPAAAQVFGTEFLPGSVSYLVAQEPATCQAILANADGGEIMTATGRSGRVAMIIRPGGIGPSTDLACPYIPAVLAADKAFRQGDVFCNHPAADVIRQIPTGTATLYAAAVLVPAQVKDPNIRGSGDGTDPTVALYTAQAGSDFANGQMIACTLAPAQASICTASLTFFLTTQAQIRTRITPAHLAAMTAALESFLRHSLRLSEGRYPGHGAQ